jgi:ABC-type transport system involved in multi-copper enzyme maturation permease subunit
MKYRLPAIGLPLLAKELLEQSARRRTYVVRTTYACLLFLLAWLMFWDIVRVSRNDPFAVLGHGRRIFTTLVYLQFAGICLFLPALACGVLTQEKERNTLSLLFLTRLGPWTIILEKYLGRLVPMFTFLLLSLPLLAFAYSMGGIPQSTLWSGIWMLVISMLQIGALAVMCSAIFCSTAGAFIGTYAFGTALFFLLPLLDELKIISAQSFLLGPRREFLFFPPIVFFDIQPGLTASGFAVALASVPILLSTLFFLVVARVCLVRRAFVVPKNYLLRCFHLLDRFFWRINQNSVTRGIVLVNDSSSLPGDEPIAWRETTKKSLGQFRYLFRVLAALEIPVAVIICLLAQSHANPRLKEASVMLFVVWIVAVLLMSVKSAGLVSAERSHQTLDVLLTTPLTGREIIQQKFRGIHRLIYVLLVPFLTIILFKTWWISSLGRDWGRGPSDAVLYLTCSVLSLAVYLPLVCWVSFFIGLKVRSQTRAIVGALATIVCWCVLPFVFLIPLFEWGIYQHRSELNFLLLSSPATIIPLNEFGELYGAGSSPWTTVVLNYIMYGLLLAVIRARCLAAADRRLGRAGGTHATPA